MGYKPTENYAAKDFLESGDPDKIVMGRELQADFDAISEAFTETDNKLQDLDYVDLRGDTMTGPLITPEVIADDIIGGDVSADTVKATNFEGNGSDITGITVDQLADVSAPNPLRDQVLAYNGSAWESVTLDIVESDLSFKGPADLTQTVPAGAGDGDMYVGDTAGVVDASWNGIGGTTTSPGDFVAYSDADSRWFSLGSVSSGAVTSVGAGSGISVDSVQPTSPVVSVDRSDTDGWYADKTTTSDALTDINRDITATNLIVADNEADISDLRDDLTDEITARIDGDAELLALIEAARPGSTVTVGDDAPDNPLEGDLWYCTLADSEGLFVWHEGAWLATDDGSGSGSELWKPCDDGTFFDGGSVGVNTETPYSRLHVEGENTPEGGITLSSGGNYHTHYLKDSFVNVHDIESSSPDTAHTWAIDGDEKVRVEASGNVGIGTTAPSQKLHVYSDNNTYIDIERPNKGSGQVGIQLIGGKTDGRTWTMYQDKDKNNLSFYTPGIGDALTIDSAGAVGIGGEPGTREAGEYLEQAKTQIAGWKSTFNDRLKAEPKADKKAVTLEITDGDFSVFPTAETLAEKLAKANIGGGTAKLQVAGDGWFSGAINPRVYAVSTGNSTAPGFTIKAGTNSGWAMIADGNKGNQFRLDNGATNVITALADGTSVGIGGAPGAGAGTIGGDTAKLQVAGDGYLHGDLRVKQLKVNSAGITREVDGYCGLNFGKSAAGPNMYPVDDKGAITNGICDIGNPTNAKFKDAHFSGTVTAGKFAGPLVGNNSTGGCYWYDNKLIPCTTDVVNSDNTHDLGQTGSGATQIRWRNAHFSGAVNALMFFRPDRGGITFSENSVVGVDKNGQITASGIDLGNSSQPFKDAHFSGTVNAANLAVAGAVNASQVYADSITRPNRFGIGFDDAAPGLTNMYIRPENADGSGSNGEIDIGGPAYKFANALFTGTVYSDNTRSNVVTADNIIQDGAPVIDTLQIIRAFMKLRSATADPDSTVEELRAKLSTAVDDIIDQFQDQIDNLDLPEELIE